MSIWLRAALASASASHDLVASPVDGPGPHGDGLPDLGLALLDQREIAGPQVQERPVEPDVEVGPAGEVPEQGRDEVAAAAEGPPL